MTTLPEPPRYAVLPLNDGYVIWDSVRAEAIDPLDRDRPVMPLAQIRAFPDKSVAERLAAKLNRIYEERM